MGTGHRHGARRTGHTGARDGRDARGADGAGTAGRAVDVGRAVRGACRSQGKGGTTGGAETGGGGASGERSRVVSGGGRRDRWSTSQGAKEECQGTSGVDGVERWVRRGGPDAAGGERHITLKTNTPNKNLRTRISPVRLTPCRSAAAPNSIDQLYPTDTKDTAQ